MATGQIINNSFPSKYQYTRNLDAQHIDIRPAITHGKEMIIKHSEIGTSYCKNLLEKVFATIILRLFAQFVFS